MKKFVIKDSIEGTYFTGKVGIKRWRKELTFAKLYSEKRGASVAINNMTLVGTHSKAYIVAVSVTIMEA